MDLTKDVEKINKMSYSDLRNELADSSHDPVKQMLIRSLMTMIGAQ